MYLVVPYYLRIRYPSFGSEPMDVVDTRLATTMLLLTITLRNLSSACWSSFSETVCALLTSETVWYCVRLDGRHYVEQVFKLKKVPNSNNVIIDGFQSGRRSDLCPCFHCNSNWI